MRHAFPVTLALALMLFSPCVATAQTITSPYRFIEERNSVSLFAGTIQTDRGRLDMGPEPAALFGIRYDLRLTGPLSGEASVGYAPTTRTVFLPPAEGSEGPGVAGGENDVGLLVAEAGLRFHLTGSRAWRGLAPFVVLTGGAVFDMAASGEVDESLAPENRFDLGPGFAAAVGLGTDFFLTERFSIRVDARDHIWRLEYPERFVQDDTADKEWRHNFALTAGGAFHF